VKRWEANKQSVNYTKMEQAEPRSAATIRRLLQEICDGNDISTANFVIDDSNRKAYYSLLLSLYQKEKSYIDKQRANGIMKSAAQGNYRGRTPVRIDDTKLSEVTTRYSGGEISAQKAADLLGVSRSTFFRKIKKKKTHNR
jgi:DNA invertase Pin-like site-specific DNA recombinase